MRSRDHMQPSLGLRDPLESILCKCGAPLRDPNHILRLYPIFHQQRVDTVIRAVYRTLTLRQLFDTYPKRLTAFLQTPGIVHPQSGPHREWIEEEQGQPEQGIG